jgi:hypothetical protein
MLELNRKTFQHTVFVSGFHRLQSPFKSRANPTRQLLKKSHEMQKLLNSAD